MVSAERVRLGRRRLLCGLGLGGLAGFAAGGTAAPVLAGSRFSMNVMVQDSVWTAAETTMSLNFLGKLAFQRSSPGELTVIGFRAQAHHESLGRVTIQQQRQSPGRLRVVPPGQWEHEFGFGLRVTIEQPSQDLLRWAGLLPTSRRPEPMELSAKDPLRLSGLCRELPPAGATYRLTDQVRLALPGKQGEPLAWIKRFPLQVVHLPKE